MKVYSCHQLFSVFILRSGLIFSSFSSKNRNAKPVYKDLFANPMCFTRSTGPRFCHSCEELIHSCWSLPKATLLMNLIWTLVLSSSYLLSRQLNVHLHLFFTRWLILNVSKRQLIRFRHNCSQLSVTALNSFGCRQSPHPIFCIDSAL